MNFIKKAYYALIFQRFMEFFLLAWYLKYSQGKNIWSSIVLQILFLAHDSGLSCLYPVIFNF